MKRWLFLMLFVVGCDQPIPGADEDMVEPDEMGELEEGREVDQDVAHVEEPPRAEERDEAEGKGEE